MEMEDVGTLCRRERLRLSMVMYQVFVCRRKQKAAAWAMNGRAALFCPESKSMGGACITVQVAIHQVVSYLNKTDLLTLPL